MRVRPSLLALVPVLAAAGCASDGTDAQPATLAEQREILASRRDASRAAVDEATGAGGLGDTAADAGGSVLDWLGGAAGTAFDLVSLQAFGIW